MDGVRFGDLPPSLCEDIGKHVSDYTVGFVTIDEESRDVDASVGGSGTLVRANNHHAILTAAHVLERLGGQQEIGLIIAGRYDPRIHRYVLQAETVTPLTVAYERRRRTRPGHPVFVRQ